MVVTYLKEKIYDLAAFFVAVLLALGRVDSSMLVELSLLFEALIAEFTDEGFVTGMGS